MNRVQASALAQYLNRCISIIPTTGAEWDLIRSLLPAIEACANGQLQLVPAPVGEVGPPKEVQTKKESP